MRLYPLLIGEGGSLNEPGKVIPKTILYLFKEKLSYHPFPLAFNEKPVRINPCQ